jgi:hypothetical protein
MSNPPADAREAILARLLVLAKTCIADPSHVFRNKLRIADELLPAISILDGDETPDDSSYGRGRPASTPVVVTMRPEIYGFVASDEASAGEELNAMRKALLKAILNDATLLGLCKDGDIRYEGFASGMANGRSLEGEMGLALAFVYVLRPKSL